MKFLHLKAAKAHLLAAAVILIATAGIIGASARYVTNLSKLQLDQNEILDSTGTSRITVGSANSITGTLSVTGNTSITGTTAFTGIVTATGTASVPYSYFGFLSMVASSSTVTPPAANYLAVGVNNILIISTGTGQGAWNKIGTQS